MFFSSEISLSNFIETEALVGKARHHWLRRKTDHAPVSENALCWSWAEATLRVGRIFRRECLCRFDFDVVWERGNFFYERALLVEIPACSDKLGNVRRVE